ncbi:MAG: Ig-like domain-containing protein [Saprospiraceae bacterium]|nr:Ig-like domain-containing protein [Saprospiraceae bacterium]
MLKTMNRNIFPFLILLMAGLLSQCASPLPPTGGAEDTIPPKVVAEESTPNFQTNFEKQRIDLEFNEWIVLEDVFNQVIVSPPLEGKLDVTLRGKTVRFNFPEGDTLRANTTYTINFGEAVKDLTEKNPAEDLRFVFSTGDELDSLRLQGQIFDAFAGTPEPEVLVMLYENLADTVVRTERPFYFGKTDEKGKFRIDNIREGDFKIFALKDVNFNYLYDLENEEIGFLAAPIRLDSSQNARIELRLFTEELPLSLKEEDTRRYGQAVLKLNRKPRDYQLTYDDFGQKLRINEMADSIKVWYDTEQQEYWKIYFQTDSSSSDTVQVRPLDRAAYLSEHPLECTNLNASSPKSINPIKQIKLNFNHPLTLIDTSLLLLLEDTLKTAVTPTFVEIDSSLGQQLSLRFPWKESMLYEVQLLPGALTDFFGQTNEDTIQQNYIVEQRTRFGNLNLTVNDLDSSKAYVIQLIFKKDQLVEESRTFGVSQFNQQYRLLAPGDYSVQVITDLNNNGRWDTGDYDEKRQPEPVRLLPLEQQLRANWEVDAELSLNAPPPPEKTEEEQK